MRNLAIVLAVVVLCACSPKGAESEAAPSAPEASTPDAEGSAPAEPNEEPAEPAQGAGPSIPVGETGGMCGGIAAFPCLNPADYCAIAEGECVSIADVAGICTVKPEVCTMDYNPVCGCDGRTYGNACGAAAAGASIASRGECPPTE
mgnify:CR=1 FL=1